jgi:KRAB domain-containing zinc finger protein
LKFHRLTHAKPVICPECGKAFSTNISLKQHLLVHSGRKDHTCEVCGRTFYTRSQVNAHQKLHAETKSHVC